jgi:K+-sensing histidine kinase KdpD
MSRGGHRLVATALCFAAAVLLTITFRGSSLKAYLPLFFLGIIIFMAAKFGSAAGIMSTVAAALLFAEFLFEPAFSMRVSDSVQRSNLLWMTIIGIAAAEIVGVRPHDPTEPKDNTN